MFAMIDWMFLLVLWSIGGSVIVCVALLCRHWSEKQREMTKREEYRLAKVLGQRPYEQIDAPEQSGGLTGMMGLLADPAVQEIIKSFLAKKQS